MVIRLKAIVTEDRQLSVELPHDIPVGAEVDIILEVAESARTDEEIAAIMAELDDIQPQTGAEIVAWLQSDKTPTSWDDIEDSGEWVAEQRCKRLDDSHTQH